MIDVTTQHIRILVISAAVLAVACGGPGPEENSGVDAQRAGAQTVPLEAVVTDAINFEGGDATDWKVFEIPSAGTYTLEFFWDAAYINGSVALHDQYGTRLDGLTHAAGREKEVLTLRLSESGLYYIRIHSDMYRTTYSVRIYEGEPRTEEDWQVDPVPEFDRPI